MRRRRRGAGRPRKPGLKRYANGRIRRGADNCAAERQRREREALRVGLSARMRHHGVTRAEARNPAIGYVLGRLRERGRGPGRSRYGITSRQHDAALSYAKLKTAFNRICDGPKAPTAVDLNRIKAPGCPGGGYENEAGDGIYERRIRRKFYLAQMSVTAADEAGLQVLEAALDDHPVTVDKLPVLRAALDALIPVFGH